MKYKCVCTHEYQDAKYGLGIRVVTPTTLNGRPAVKCTVCGKVQLAKVEK